MTDLDAVLAAAREAAQAAAAIQLAGFRSRPAARTKSTAIDFVTEFDQRSEAAIKARLAPLGLDVVGEETGGSPGERTLYVDPLDGTTNFLHGHPFFCISIGLVEHGVPTVGLVHAPALGVIWEGVRGRGATRNGVPCRVTETARVDEALLATGFPYDRREQDDDNLREFARFKKRTRGVRRGGSAAIDLAMVADGTYDGYWEMKLNPWDWAAGALLVAEAGGRLSRYDGSPADVREPRDGPRRTELVASNGALHAALLATLNEA